MSAESSFDCQLACVLPGYIFLQFIASRPSKGLAG